MLAGRKGTTPAELGVARDLDYVLEAAERRGDDPAVVRSVVRRWRRWVRL